jgi:hypothetical protein
MKSDAPERKQRVINSTQKQGMKSDDPESKQRVINNTLKQG